VDPFPKSAPTAPDSASSRNDRAPSGAGAIRLALSGFLFEEVGGGNAQSLGRFCEAAREWGYDGVELRRSQIGPDSSPRKRVAARRAASDSGVIISCVASKGMKPGEGLGRDDLYLRYLELCRDLDCGLLKVAGEVEWMRWAVERAAEAGVVLASNNHAGGPLESVEGTREYMASMDHHHFRLLYDSFHLMRAGEDYLGCIAEFAPRTANILAQTRRVDSRGGGEPAMPGSQGSQDWPQVIRRFVDSGYSGWLTVIENAWPAADRGEVAAFNARYFRELLASK